MGCFSSRVQSYTDPPASDHRFGPFGDSLLEHIVADVKALLAAKNCGPILIRLSWHDAGVFSNGSLKGGCPNAVMRFTDSGEGTFEANKGLPDVAYRQLLKPIADKYAGVISNADLWALAANVAIEFMGGPHVVTRFGRLDAKDSGESVESQVGRLPDGDKGVSHLREVFAPKGFDDRDIVALSGAHTVGGCKQERSGFDGLWTETPFVFDNSYFTDLLEKTYRPETVEATGCPQHRSDKGTIMLISDLALLEDAAFKSVVQEYAADESRFFADFVSAWTRHQENGVGDLLRDELAPPK